MDASLTIELIKLTKCHGEGRCILSSVILQMKIKHATDALFLILQHEYQLLQLINDMSSNESRMDFQSFASILKYSLGTLRKRLKAIMQHTARLLHQVHDNLSSLKSYYEGNLTLANELLKLGLHAIGDSKRNLALGEKKIFDEINALLKKAIIMSESPSAISVNGNSSSDNRRLSSEVEGLHSNYDRIISRSPTSNEINVNNEAESVSSSSKRKQEEIYTASDNHNNSDASCKKKS